MAFPPIAAMTEPIEPFEIHVSDLVLEDLGDRLAATRFPDEIEDTGWEYGMPMGYLRELVDYWRDGYDWRARGAAQRAPALPYRIDGQQVHFVHARSPHADAFPLLLIHGWPGSIVEFLDVIPRLTDPENHGGRAEDAFHVIVPSLPGYGFSEPTAHAAGTRSASRTRSSSSWIGWATRATARRAATGVRRSRRGSARSTRSTAPPSISTCRSRCRPEDPVALTDEEKADLAAFAQFQREESAYALEQGTKPQTLGVALNDSPAGLLAWIVEKFRAWSDCDGDPENTFTRDQLLTNVMLYWVTRTITSSARLYRESRQADLRGEAPQYVGVPTGVARYPKEVLRFPRSWVEQRYNVTHWADMPRRPLRRDGTARALRRRSTQLLSNRALKGESRWDCWTARWRSSPAPDREWPRRR